MAHYLIFVPGAAGVSTECLKHVGLAELLRDDEPGPDAIECDRGPGGKSGLLMTWRTGDPAVDPRLMMHDRLEWKPAVRIDHPELGELKAKRYWIGIDLDNPIKPSDLARKNQVRGLNITLGDGMTYAVPTISRFPNSYQLADGGEIKRVVKEQYAEFYRLGMSVAADVLDEFEKVETIRDRVPDIDDYSIEVTAVDGLRLIAAAIALNYRLNWELVYLLGLLDESTAAMALMAFCELQEIRETIDAKKKLPPVSILVGSYS